MGGCGFKPEQLPFPTYPYVAEMEFLKSVENDNGRVKKERFKDDIIVSPFFFQVKIKEIENSGTIRVLFFDSRNRKVDEKHFRFGEPGKYYEHIICFDEVERLSPGTYRFAVFYNSGLLYENGLKISGDNKSPESTAGDAVK